MDIYSRFYFKIYSISKNTPILLKAKKAIDESYNKQLQTPFVKSKTKQKCIYRGAIYLDYWMMSPYNSSIFDEVSSYGEEKMKESTFGSFSKCLELDIKKQWTSDIKNKMMTYRNQSINVGVDNFIKKNYENAFSSFKMAIEMYNILSLTDTLAMINAALSSEKMKKTDEAFKYYKMCADNNYGKEQRCTNL